MDVPLRSQNLWLMAGILLFKATTGSAAASVNAPGIGTIGK